MFGCKTKNPNKDVVNFECVLYGMENVVASVAISSNSDDTKHVANKIVIFILGTNAKDDDRLHVTAERSASGLAILPSGHYAQCVCKRVCRHCLTVAHHLQSHTSSGVKTFNTFVA